MANLRGDEGSVGRARSSKSSRARAGDGASRKGRLLAVEPKSGVSEVRPEALPTAPLMTPAVFGRTMLGIMGGVLTGKIKAKDAKESIAAARNYLKAVELKARHGAGAFDL